MFREFAGLLKRVSAAAGVASLVAFAGQANAVSYVGSWDPAFGPDFPTLGWRGEAVFEIPVQCLGLNGGFGIYNIFSPCATANGGLKIERADVEFYNVNTPGFPTIQTLTFLEPSLTVTMEVRNGELYGVTGGFQNAVTSNITEVKLEGWQDTAPASFTLFFVDQPLGSSLFSPPGTADYYAQMRWTQKREAGDSCIKILGVVVDCSFGYSTLDVQNRGTFLTFQRVLQVPEPGSLALLLPAVGMLAAFRRRRSASAA